ncbi:MAG: UDP-N-acetylmuramate--L-alanine ligase [Alphaproteobacteria bacterium]|nr:UDP-N-acetylmuramate--L-alanine ligase [Alphaproteobacteria bacterium]
MKRYFFCGIGGSGMSALALALKSKGAQIDGSDRARDAGAYADKFDALEKQGICLFPQDGSGLNEQTDALVVSSAVEETIPDVVKAREFNIPVYTRAQLLAEFLHEHNGIAVGGTSGKTTTTGMIGHILKEAGVDPSVINGGVMLNYADSSGLGNVIVGKGTFCVVEADESDGSIELYRPEVSIVTSISLDHKPLEELRKLFGDFVERASVGAVLNADNPDAIALKSRNSNVLSFSVQGADADLKAEDITPEKEGVRFTLDGEQIFLPMIGRHNAANALAAIAAVEMIGVTRSQAIQALATFKGIHRRLETIGVTKKGITVIDDFAHNPEKIAASLSALKEYDGRLIVIFQPHGFKPTKMLRAGIVEAFDRFLSLDDTLIMPEIYYAGGTAQKDISSADLIKDLEKTGKRVHFIPNRKKILALVKGLAVKGDRIIVMGARDETLSDFARDIYEAVS